MILHHPSDATLIARAAGTLASARFFRSLQDGRDEPCERCYSRIVWCQPPTPTRHGARGRTIHVFQCWSRKRCGWLAAADHDAIGRQCGACSDYFPANPYYFFTGGIMPSHGLIRVLDLPASPEADWRWISGWTEPLLLLATAALFGARGGTKRASAGRRLGRR